MTYSVFKVHKKPIEVLVGDMVLYKYDEPYMPDFSSAVSVREISSLDLYFVTEGDMVYLKTDDENHEIICTPGKIIRYDRLSPEDVTLISALSILLFLLILVILLTLLYRRKILHVLAAMRCRRAFAIGKFTDPVPIFSQEKEKEDVAVQKMEHI